MIEVYLYDADCKNFLEPDRWARETCASYRGVTVSDIANMSLPSDEVAVYRFGNSADAAWFTLTWKAK